MASKTNFKVNGQEYYRITKTIGRKLNENGVEVPVRKQFTGKSKKEAMQKYEDFMIKRKHGLVDSKHYFGIVADNWIYNFFIHDSTIKDTTKLLYIGHWNNYIRGTELYTLSFDEISSATIQEVYNDMNAPLSAIKSVNKLMKRFYRYLEHEGYSRNITTSLVVPKRERTIDDDEGEIVIWTDEELHLILNSFDKADPRFRMRFLIVLAYSTGCRINELLAIKYADITDNGVRINKQVINRPVFKKGEKNTFTLDLDPPKSKASYRTVPINSDVKRELKRHKKWHEKEMKELGYETEFVFSTDSGGLCDARNVGRACARYYDRIGVERKGFHTYRHTFGTNLCRNGIPIQTASALLGHEDISVTAKYYVNIASDQKQKAVESLTGILKTS